MKSSKRLTGQQYLSILACVLLTAMVSIYTMTTYMKGPLNGNFDHYLMQADRWGMPEDIKQRGVTPLYLDEWNSGWDGQFYYYIANDLMGLKDTPEHIDADAYRYQRVGIPVLSKILSLALFQDWVSPFIYYLTHFLLILLGTAVAARFFIKEGVPAYWIIPWAVGMGTQITLLNGLPDGAADALLIIGMISAYQKKYGIYALAITFACLSREAYVAFPALFFGAQVLERLIKRKSIRPVPELLVMLFPLVVFVAWHTYIRLHFTMTPAEQGTSILGVPFLNLLTHMIAGLQGHYPKMGSGWDSYMAGTGLVLFTILLAWTIWTIAKTRPVQSVLQGNIVSNTTVAFTLTLCLLYLCFGETVIWNFTGYMKAGGLFLFCIPFIAAINGRRPHAATFVLAMGITAFFSWQGWLLRVDQPTIKYKFDVQCHHLKIDTGSTCREHFIWSGDELAGLVGTVQNGNRVAAQGLTPSGFISFGPYIELPKGRYRVELTISGDGSDLGYTDIIGINSRDTAVTLSKQPLTAGDDVKIQTELDVDESFIRNLEVRTWYQSGNLSLKSLSVERLAN
ncbi:MULTISPECIES: hypothetical protein [Pseudomonas]|uniref:Glycosyltransferase RgtA/B/C/D-like domain-containing protein n=1 Tax=Pseudomonas aphyarum TaxID=2942629 RepID=A0ABT5PHS0_9PSED|nr:hypothetical protein [Pseudomonas aphyarum]MDD0970028.1 hypothetical protein [Pseudomonas aphyarum]MDD1123434.1 hypothetical protein [Pseudomonas aphyarum]